MEWFCEGQRWVRDGCVSTDYERRIGPAFYRSSISRLFQCPLCRGPRLPHFHSAIYILDVCWLGIRTSPHCPYQRGILLHQSLIFKHPYDATEKKPPHHTSFPNNARIIDSYLQASASRRGCMQPNLLTGFTAKENSRVIKIVSTITVYEF